MLRSTLSAAAFVGLLAVSAPVVAQAAQPEGTTRLTLNKKTGDYCAAADVVTGSRIARPECHTMADWAALGLTVAARPKALAAN